MAGVVATWYGHLDVELAAIESGDSDRMREALLDDDGQERLFGEGFQDTGSAGLADRGCGHVFKLSFPYNTPENLALLGRAVTTAPTSSTGTTSTTTGTPST